MAASRNYKLPRYSEEVDTYLLDESVLVYSKKTQQVRGYEKGNAALYLQVEYLLQSHSREDIFLMFPQVAGELLCEMIELAGGNGKIDVLAYQKSLELGRFVADPLARTMYVVADLGFAIHYPDEELFAALHPIFEHLNVQYNDLKLKVAIDFIPSGTLWKIKWNDTVTQAVIPQARLAAYLQDLMMTAAFQSQSLLIKLHAASIEKQGRVVIMPAVGESGKSTLTASMLRNGFTLFSDEATSMDMEGYVQPLPFCLSIKEGSWGVLAPIYPHLGELDVHSRFDGQNIRFLSPEPMREERRKASHIVFPQYTPGSRTLLTPLGTTPALLKIKEAGYYVRDSMDDKKFARIIDNLLSLPKYTLVYSNLDEAIAAIDDLIASDIIKMSDGI
jgi:hypothetical protein